MTDSIKDYEANYLSFKRSILFMTRSDSPRHIERKMNFTLSPRTILHKSGLNLKCGEIQFFFLNYRISFELKTSIIY